MRSNQSTDRPTRAFGFEEGTQFAGAAQPERSLEYRMKRMAVEEMLSTEQAARLLGTSRVTINAWIAKGRALGLTQVKRGKKMPRWQFEPAMWSTLLTLSDALCTRDGWEMLAFLETPHAALKGATPRSAIEDGYAAQVLELAAASAT